ncbi:MAG: hypothetical protein LW698_15775 [Planctomycetaceae bacterium]|nr:hypothetical protein [Planctomycetaceae bacterium]
MRPLVLCLVIGTVTGCVTHGQRMRDVRAAFHRGDLAAAERALEQQRAAGGDTDVLDLDHAMVALAAGRPAEAERLLRRPARITRRCSSGPCWPWPTWPTTETTPRPTACR